MQRILNDIEQWSSKWGKHTRRGNVKTSYGVRKIKKKVYFVIYTEKSGPFRVSHRRPG
jgi:hypothetical protein